MDITVVQICAEMARKINENMTNCCHNGNIKIFQYKPAFTQSTIFFFQDDTNPLIGTLPFTPVVENPNAHEAFLTEDPKKALQEGRIPKVPMMIGVTDLEAGGKWSDVLKGGENGGSKWILKYFCRI